MPGQVDILVSWRGEYTASDPQRAAYALQLLKGKGVQILKGKLFAWSLVTYASLSVVS
jgi:hypothetical protein